MRSAKELIKACLPDSIVEKISAARMAAWRRKWDRMGPEERFTHIYAQNRWACDESRSGPGSRMHATRRIRAQLPELLADLGVRSLLDVPCGDFNWMKELDLDIDYIGGDVVRELVELDQHTYGNSRRRFIQLDLTSDTLPKADAIFCRDCLVHLSFSDVELAMTNILNSDARFLMVTTYPDCQENRDIATGDWRQLNFTRPPFNWPEPYRIVDDAVSLDAENPNRDKSIGVWRIMDGAIV